jgi:hypothetical protein
MPLPHVDLTAWSRYCQCIRIETVLSNDHRRGAETTYRTVNKRIGSAKMTTMRFYCLLAFLGVAGCSKPKPPVHPAPGQPEPPAHLCNAPTEYKNCPPH